MLTVLSVGTGMSKLIKGMNREQTRQEMMAMFLEHALFNWDTCVIRYQDQNIYVPGRPGNLYEGTYQSAKNITIETAQIILRDYWSTATISEAEKAITRLIEVGKLRRLRADSFKILRADPTPPKPNPYNHFLGQAVLDMGRKYKNGECPRCGTRVMNTNRHNNPLHTGDECRLARVKNILDC